MITRKTQWERPTEDDQDGDIMMDLETPDSEDNDEVYKVIFVLMIDFLINFEV